eukprot:m.1345107 g.1345107  ORF g.1345107 m.1345107 type:complete len:540 (+) comp24904_c0_seq8:227-1846(+)
MGLIVFQLVCLACLIIPPTFGDDSVEGYHDLSQIHSHTRNLHNFMDAMQETFGRQGDGYVSTIEFLRFLTATGGLHGSNDRFTEAQLERAQIALAYLDKDHDGRMSLQDLAGASSIFGAREEGPNDVQQVHLAPDCDPTKMHVTFATVGSKVHASGAAFELSDGRIFPARAYTYTVPSRWWEPEGWIGWLYSATFDNLTPGQVYTYVAKTSTNSSQRYSFRASPPAGSHGAVRFATWGDMGTVMPFGFAVFDKVAEMHASDPFDFVLHQGDVSYAGVDVTEKPLNISSDDEFEYIWDLFGRQIEPVAATAPYVTGAGNHEAWYNWTAFTHRYTMPASTGSNGNFWFSFDYGPVHIVSASSEHDYSVDSPQIQWIRKDLEAASANRANVPWIVFSCHRPFLSSDADEYAAHTPGAPLLTAFEPLLLQYGVDLTLTGHQHAYERVHPNKNGTQIEYPDSAGVYHNPSAPVHLLVGAAGAMQEEHWVKPSPAWSAVRIADAFPNLLESYGFGTVSIANATHLSFTFTPVEGNTTDSFSIIKD